MHTGNPVVFVLSPRQKRAPNIPKDGLWSGEKFKVCVLLSSKKEGKKIAQFPGQE